jgi:hypothetical protein
MPIPDPGTNRTLRRLIVADPPAVRVRRSRKHKAGDHSECRPERCPDAPQPEPDPEPASDQGTKPLVGGLPADELAGRIEASTRTLIEALPYEDGDPRKILGELAIELAKRIDDDGAVPASVRELRVLLVFLVEIPNEASGPVDELRLRRFQRRLDGLLAAAV